MDGRKTHVAGLSLELTWKWKKQHLFVVDFMVFRKRGQDVHFHVVLSVVTLKDVKPVASTSHLAPLLPGSLRYP